MSFKRVRSLPLLPSGVGKEASPSSSPGPDMEVEDAAMVGQSELSIRKTAPYRSSSSIHGCNRDALSSSHDQSAPSVALDSNIIGTINGNKNASHRRSGGGGSFDASEISGFRRKNSASSAIATAVWGNSQCSAHHGSLPSKQPCSSFLRGHCPLGKLCAFLHSFSSTKDMRLMTTLHGHEKTVRSIVLPVGSNNMYTGSQDKTIRVWDCETGQCANVVQMEGDVGCLLAESGWLFVGLPNEVKALNLHTNSEQRLEGPIGQVHALVVFNDMLLGGAEDGRILAWRFNTMLSMFQPTATLMGHVGAVVSLEAMDGRLYSGSADFTIKVWDLITGICMQTLRAHSNVVMGLLCWNQYLISGSLDGTVKVWEVNHSGALHLLYTHPKDAGVHEHLDGVLAFCGFVDRQNKDMLLCSLDDNSVRLLELPSFTERGVMFSMDEIRALQVTPSGLVISGDSGGNIKVWKWAP